MEERRVAGQLIRNGQLQMQRTEQGGNSIDFYPVVKLFTPDAGCTWLLSEINPEENDIAFGLCDLGLGCPELGYVSISEISTLRGRLGLPVERDLFFEANKPISEYAYSAKSLGYIDV